MERNRTDNDLLQRMDERGEESTDAFGKAIADGTRNTIDVPSIYSFSPERLRLYLDDARQEPGDVSAKFTDQDGNTVTSDPDPGGYQVALARFESGGQGNSTRVATSQQTENKRPLYEDDVAVFLYKADSASSDTVNLTYFIEQDW